MKSMVFIKSALLGQFWALNECHIGWSYWLQAINPSTTEIEPYLFERDCRIWLDVVWYSMVWTWFVDAPTTARSISHNCRHWSRWAVWWRKKTISPKLLSAISCQLTAASYPVARFFVTPNWEHCWAAHLVIWGIAHCTMDWNGLSRVLKLSSLVYRHCSKTVQGGIRQNNVQRSSIYHIVEFKEQMFKWLLDGVSVQAFFAISFQISWLNWF